jgi:hypothetical protein
MTLSRREHVLSTFFGLFAPLSTSYPTIARMPNWAIAFEHLPCIVQMDGGATKLEAVGPSWVLDLRIYVAVGVRSTTDDQLGPDLSEARAEVLELVAANNTLNGLADFARWEADEDPDTVLRAGAPPHGVLWLHFGVIYAEAIMDPRAAQ